MHFVGIYVNPKTLAPCAAFRIKERTILVSDERLELIGEGYFSGSGDDVKYSISQESGYPRFHCPSGIVAGHRKRGYGTTLYAAAAGAAYMHDRYGLVLRGLSVIDAGISSNSERSPEAEKWWTSALHAGVAYRVDIDVSEYASDEAVETEDFTEELVEQASGRSVEGRAAQDARDAVQRWANVKFDDYASVDRVTVEGTITRTVSGESYLPDAADVLPYLPNADAIGVQNICLLATNEAWDVRFSANVVRSLTFQPNDDAEWNTTLAEVVNVKKVSAPMYRFLEAAYKDAGQAALFRELTAQGAGDVPEGIFGDDADFFARTNPSRRRRRNPVDRRREEALAALNITAYADLDD
jgi:hypothetical protein